MAYAGSTYRRVSQQSIGFRSRNPAHTARRSGAQSWTTASSCITDSTRTALTALRCCRGCCVLTTGSIPTGNLTPPSAATNRGTRTRIALTLYSTRLGMDLAATCTVKSRAPAHGSRRLHRLRHRRHLHRRHRWSSPRVTWHSVTLSMSREPRRRSRQPRSGGTHWCTASGRLEDSRAGKRARGVQRQRSCEHGSSARDLVENAGLCSTTA